MGIDAILAIIGLVGPPVVDFIKKKFIPEENDTPERTMGTLATTNPDVLPQYITAMAGYFESMKGWFNRDVTGSPSQWVTDLRAAIRPLAVVGAFVILGGMVVGTGLGWTPAEGLKETIAGIRGACILTVTSWMGDRISITGLVR